MYTKLNKLPKTLSSIRKNLAFVLLILALYSIPATIILVRQQQDIRQHAQEACQKLLQHSECVECNIAVSLYKDSCTGELTKGKRENNTSCSSLCPKPSTTTHQP